MQYQVSILKYMIYGAVELGADFHELCRRINITPEQLNDGEGYVTWEPGESKDFWVHAVELTGDPCVGLKIGALRINYFAFGLVGMLLNSSKTVREVLQAICKYNDTLTQVYTYSLEFKGDIANFYFNPHPLWEKTSPEGARQSADVFSASLVRGIRDSTKRNVSPVQCKFRFRVRNVPEYDRIFKTDLQFNAGTNCLVFSKEDLNEPLIGYDESLYATFNNLVLQKQKQLKGLQTMTEQVRALLLTKFNGHAVHIDIVASQFSMTTRTLQRKLAEENTSYRKISNELRKQLAEDLIIHSKDKKGEIASILGFADIRSFNRAFNSWSNSK
jgi:AraC-like DNA-binding protein